MITVRYPMKPAVILAIALTLAAQAPPRDPSSEAPRRLPDGRSQTEAILKADHEKTLRDADDLMKLAEDLKIDIEKNDRHVLSVGTLKKLDEIEKVVKRIRGRLKRF